MLETCDGGNGGFPVVWASVGVVPAQAAHQRKKRRNQNL